MRAAGTHWECICACASMPGTVSPDHIFVETDKTYPGLEKKATIGLG